MSMPLPLELTKPILLTGNLDALVESQLCGGGTRSQAQSQSFNLLTGITVDGVDAVVDDNDVL
jgi:hypothetical protein